MVADSFIRVSGTDCWHNCTLRAFPGGLPWSDDDLSSNIRGELETRIMTSSDGLFSGKGDKVRTPRGSEGAR